MKIHQWRTVGVALTASLVAAAALAVASPAAAAPLDPSNEIAGGAYTIVHTPMERSGYDEDLGMGLYVFGPQTTSVSTGCPEGYRAASRSMIVASDGTETNVMVGPPRTVLGVSWGLEGEPIDLQDNQRSEFNAILDRGQDGLHQFVITCETSVPEANAPIGAAKYFVSDIEFDHTALTWKIVDRPGGGPEKVATATALAAASTTAIATTLTATITPAAGTGTVQFKKDGANVDGPVAVTNGTATLVATGLSASTSYSFTAEYSGDETHAASVSPVRAVTTLPTQPGGTPGDTDGTDVIVDVPEPGGQGGLTISTAPNSVVLAGGLREAGKDWAATGTLETVTVIDDRRNAAAGAWSLSGASSAFTSGGNSFAASTFGWKPKDLTGAGQAGAETTDLSSAKPLASGAASAATEVTTSIKAGLTLTVPSGTPSGDYTAKLTLTLI